MKNLLNSLIVLLILSSCATQRKFNRIADKHENWLLERCVSSYPIKDTVIVGKTDTVLKTSLRVDTVTTVVTNTITGKKELVKLPCPPCKETTRTILRTDTVKVRDTRIERRLQLIIQQKEASIKEANTALVKAETSRDQYKKERNGMLWAIVGLLVIAGVLKFLRVI